LRGWTRRKCSSLVENRSRSPASSTENYAAKLAAAYVLHPGHENDSYYFLKKL
jgi:hypothetical protein